MASTYTLAAAALETMITAEFAAESFVPVHDNVHDSLGFNGTVIGIAPLYESPNVRVREAEETWIRVKFLGAWNKTIDPTQTVDPRTIADYAWRLQRRIKTTTVTKSSNLWYFNVERTEYPDDPTGNKTRFIMDVRVWANNPSITETAA